MSKYLDLLHAVTDWCYGDIEALLDFCEAHSLLINDVAFEVDNYSGESRDINDWFNEAYRLAAVKWLDKLKEHALPTDNFDKCYDELQDNQFHIHLNYMCSCCCYDNDFLSNYVGSEDYDGALNYLREEKLI